MACWRRHFSRILLAMLLVYLSGFLYFLASSSSARQNSVHVNFSFIDDVIKGRWRRGIVEPYVRPQCQARDRLAFIKCMKCGTETLGTVFRRYAYLRNLSAVLPVDKRIYLGWPFPITPLDYRPSSRGYSILMEHSIYNHNFMKTLMDPGTNFVSMLRHPLDHFVSTLHYFNVFNLSGMTVSNGMPAVRAYLADIRRYENVYKSPAAAPKRYCIPDGFSVTRNLMSHCLGMPLGFPSGTPDISQDSEAVRRYIEGLDREFTLVMLMEHFEESLVLLKRLMCWNTKDIVFRSVNKGGYRNSMNWSELTPLDREMHEDWSSVDYTLYRHFNRSFWDKVNQQGPGFFLEVDHFRDVQRQVTGFCQKVSSYGDGVIHFPSSTWSPPFSFTTADCRLLESPLLVLLKQQYENHEPLYFNISTPPLPRKFVPLC